MGEEINLTTISENDTVLTIANADALLSDGNYAAAYRQWRRGLRKRTWHQWPWP